MLATIKSGNLIFRNTRKLANHLMSYFCCVPNRMLGVRSIQAYSSKRLCFLFSYHLYDFLWKQYHRNIHVDWIIFNKVHSILSIKAFRPLTSVNERLGWVWTKLYAHIYLLLYPGSETKCMVRLQKIIFTRYMRSEFFFKCCAAGKRRCFPMQLNQMPKSSHSAKRLGSIVSYQCHGLLHKLSQMTTLALNKKKFLNSNICLIWPKN